MDRAHFGGIDCASSRRCENAADAVQEEPTRVVGAEVPFETIDAPLEEDEPVAPVDESIAAKLAEDAHRSWIQSITDQLGRMRRREEDLREPPAETTAEATDGHTAGRSQGDRITWRDLAKPLTRLRRCLPKTRRTRPPLKRRPFSSSWPRWRMWRNERNNRPHGRRRSPRRGATMPVRPGRPCHFLPYPVEEFLRAALVEEPTEADPPSPKIVVPIDGQAARPGIRRAAALETELAASPGGRAFESPPPERSTETIAESTPPTSRSPPEFSTGLRPNRYQRKPGQSQAIRAMKDGPRSQRLKRGRAPGQSRAGADGFHSRSLRIRTDRRRPDAEPETLEQPATSLAEPVAAESWSAWTERVSEEAIAPRVDDGDERRRTPSRKNRPGSLARR